MADQRTPIEVVALERLRLEQRTLLGLLPPILLRDIRAVLADNELGVEEEDRELMERILRVRVEELRDEHAEWIASCIDARRRRELSVFIRHQVDRLPLDASSDHLTRTADFASELALLGEPSIPTAEPSGIWRLVSYLVWADRLAPQA